MDYGELAYIKASEIEAYLNGESAKREKRNAISAAFRPRMELSGGYEPCTVTGSGNMGLTVSLSLRAPTGASDIKVRLYCGDKIAAYTSVTLSAGTSGRFVLLASVYPTGGEKLRITSSASGLILEEMTVLCDGANAGISGGDELLKCDCMDGSAYLLYCEDGDLYLENRDGAKTLVAHASEYDLVAADGNIRVVCRDDFGNLWGVSYDASLAETGRKNLGDGPERVSVGRNANGLTIAGIKRGEVILGECASDFSGMTDFYGTGINNADGVALCKQTDMPVLFVTKGGEVYCKIPVFEFSSRDCVSAEITLCIG